MEEEQVGFFLLLFFVCWFFLCSVVVFVGVFYCGGGAGGLQGEGDRLLLFLQVKEVKNVQSMYQREREDLKRAIEEMQKKFNQLKVRCSVVIFVKNPDLRSTLRKR